MSLYEKLDWVADSYSPILLVIAISVIVHVFRTQGRHQGSLRVAQLFLLLALVYLLQFIDNRWMIWHSFGLDYSTHTAFALAIVVFTWFDGRKLRIGILISFIAYLLLMLYQQYHTVADMVTTILVLTPLMYLISRLLIRVIPTSKLAT
ncbi:hypothetical protein [Aliikangiella coralliicola]|uniref:Phosphatase PAP2 family protein n=1 Tax=Aliikangiella coralliicola TaxID=2592383 RepID=A0A545UJM4_9GAMM|nr:hypothetical protein [Aliikangiella coralliicola]TQV89633.1 hypothetical protein FLL46_01760 [Aliikangiella coralliicola]